MDWSAAGAPMIATRAIHFAATATMTGTLVFRMVVAKPVLRSEEGIANRLQTQTLRVLWLALAAATISGAIWLLLQAGSMSGLPSNEAMSTDVLSTVINETQFGQVTTIRLGLAIGLAACLACYRVAIAEWLALAAALGFAASLAWTGHAGSTLGAMGYLHLAADTLHLIAAAAWIGGLVALSLFLAIAHRNNAMSLARNVVARFSTLGIVSVAILMLSGIINAAILVGSLHGLVATEYGRVLTLKVAMFAVMLVFAAINRFRLTPQLASFGNEQSSNALRQLIHNSAIETAFGLGILVIVAMLGTMHPAVHYDLAMTGDYQSYIGPCRAQTLSSAHGHH